MGLQCMCVAGGLAGWRVTCAQELAGSLALSMTVSSPLMAVSMRVEPGAFSAWYGLGSRQGNGSRSPRRIPLGGEGNVTTQDN